MPNRKSLLKDSPDFILFLILMIPLSAMLFIKCRYGFANIDESFYLTIPYRLTQGDVLLLHEWHLSQLISWVLQIPVKAYLLLFGSTDGIILAFRYLYVGLHICSSTALYLMLRKHSKVGAVLSSVFFCLYVPFGISAMSYNSLGIEFLTLASVVLTCASRKWTRVLSGVFFALSVLCCPYLAVVYLLYFAGVMCFRATHRSWENVAFLSMDCFFWFSVGVFATAFAFCVCVLPRIPLSKWGGIISGLFSDPEHQRSMGEGLWEYGRILFKRADVWCLVLATVLGCVIKNKSFRAVCSVIVLFSTAVSVLRCTEYINFLMFPLGISGVYFYLVYRNKTAGALFYGIWIPGMVYTLCIHLSSNQAFYAISSASTVPLVASVMIIAITCGEILRSDVRRVLKSGLILSMILLVSLQGYFQTQLRWSFLFWDTPMSDQTSVVTEGPHKGLWVSPPKNEQYMAKYEAAKQLKPGGTVLFFGESTYCYLFGDWQNGSFSAWMGIPGAGTFWRLEQYYQLNPDKLPDQVFIEASYGDFAANFLDSEVYALRSITEQGDYILSRAEWFQFGE